MLSHHLKKISNFFLPAKKTASRSIISEANQLTHSEKNHTTRVVVSRPGNKNKVHAGDEETDLMLQDWWIN
jgi:hypothetical protein